MVIEIIQIIQRINPVNIKVQSELFETT